MVYKRCNVKIFYINWDEDGVDRECWVKAERPTHCIVTFKPEEAIPLTPSMIEKLEDDGRVRLER